jgi:DNA-binding transcriptional ArsR family regulator
VTDEDKVFKALADANRRRLIDRLHERNGQTLTQLCEGLAMTRQSVTQHLDLLEAANLVSVRWKGREKLHFFNPVPIHAISARWIRKFERERLDALAALKTTLEGESHD